MSIVRQLWASLEDIDGTPHQEIEYTFFGLVDNFEWIKGAASSEVQEQWEVFLPKGPELNGKLRIRAVNDREWIFCTKVNRSSELGVKEVEQLTTQGMFKAFCEIATTGYRKTRYNFPVPDSDLVWEIDVYVTPEGKPYPFIKIDLEVTDVDTPVPELPIEITDPIMSQHSARTPEEHRRIQQLFDDCQLAKKV